MEGEKREIQTLRDILILKCTKAGRYKTYSGWVTELTRNADLQIVALAS